ncbi:MAG: DUF5701 family protein [bacterium]|nr:DUF5701 family protein [bacterium]
MATIAVNTAAAALKQLFDRQAEQVIELSGDEAGIKALYPLLEKIGKVTEGEGRISFVIILQKPELTFQARMEKVALYGKTGASYLADNLVTNLDDIPQGHYLAVDVEDGRAMLDKNPSVCLKRFRRARRFGGTLAEGISAVTYEPWVLRHHFIDFPGSRFGSDFVPCLAVYDRPKLNARWKGNARPHYGSLSCGSRLAIRS